MRGKNFLSMEYLKGLEQLGNTEDLAEEEYRLSDSKALDFLSEFDVELFKKTLTERQLLVLEGILDGYKQYEVAKLLGVSEPAITKHKHLIRNKVNKFLLLINKEQKEFKDISKGMPEID
jgi:DNA-binding NarL/FixJ family response regulator